MARSGPPASDLTGPRRVAASAKAVHAALAAWRRALGTENVLTDGDVLGRAATATFPTTQKVIAILRPARREEVQQCLRIAQRHGTPVYPVSGGRNWGYGSRVPPEGGCAILDLARLDGIRDFDERLGHVTVEPGVTFGKLFAFLQARTARLFLSVPGSGPEASVIGNAVERGDATGPQGDRFAHVCGLEVVLPTGELVHTGFARFDGARAARVARWGVGPSLDGLFSQSNLGVVTAMTVWLTPRPGHFELAFLAITDGEKLPALVDALQQLRMEGTIRGTFALWNDYKALSLCGGYPWEAAGGVTPLPEALLERTRAETGFGRWNGTIGLYAASRAQGLADRARVEEVLLSRVDVLAWDDRAPGVAWEDLDARGPGLGVPHERSVAGMYWRKRQGATATEPATATLTSFTASAELSRREPRATETETETATARGTLTPTLSRTRERETEGAIDPERDGCGYLWCTPAVPFVGGEVDSVLALCEEAIGGAGFEPQIAVVFASERLALVCAAIVWDRAAEGDDARAMACHDALLARLIGGGYLPFRLGVQSMAALPAGSDDTAELLRRIKALLDPRGILAPGRYAPSPVIESPRDHGE
ncbi:MAG: FAD-binding oxidoreductase [Myxococcales bacterium]|nr:FAD-binding oxidoreductase [Myxococcales bacterium]